MTSLSSAKLKTSYNKSIEIIKDHSKSFYQGFKQLPKEKFLAVASIYAFCRTVDDVADDSNDENKLESLKTLEAIEADILALETGETIYNDYVWWPAFTKTVADYSIPSLGFMMQLAGQRSDIHFVDIRDMEELIEYSRLVAGSVGRMLLPILTSNEAHRKDPILNEACENLGIAMQITNILRDVGEDLSLRNRMYLPQTILEKYKLSKETIKALIPPDKDSKEFKSFIQLWEELADVSDRYYASFNQHLPKLDDDSILPVYASAQIYRAIMDEVRENDYDCLTKRNYVNATKKSQLLQKAKQDVVQLIS